MDKREIQRFARLVREQIERRWGKDWQRYFVADVREALVANAALEIGCGWERNAQIPTSDLVAIYRAARDLILGNDSIHAPRA